MSNLILAAEQFLSNAKLAEAKAATALGGFKEALDLAENERLERMEAAREKLRTAGEMARDALAEMETAEAQHAADLEEIKGEIFKMQRVRLKASKPVTIRAAE